MTGLWTLRLQLLLACLVSVAVLLSLVVETEALYKYAQSTKPIYFDHLEQIANK